MLGLHSQFVEKDYWVTQTLRILYEDYPGHFIFKGGTSLSKGFGLIERFSEDVDVLVVGEAVTVPGFGRGSWRTSLVGWQSVWGCSRGKNARPGGDAMRAEGTCSPMPQPCLKPFRPD